MCGEGGEGGGDAPDVNVVKVDDAADFAGGGGDGAGVEPWRGAFEQDGCGLTEEVEGAWEDERGDEDGGDGVECGGGAEGDGCGGGDDEDGAEGVGEGFEGGAADVEVSMAVAVEDAEDEEVDAEAGERGEEDGAGLDGGLAVEAADGFVDDEDGDGSEEGDVDGDGEDFDAGVAEGSARVGGASGDGGCEEGEREPGGIGHHVASVGDKGDGAEGEADKGLGEGERESEEEAEEEGAAVEVVGGHVGIVARVGGLHCRYSLSVTTLCSVRVGRWWGRGGGFFRGCGRYRAVKLKGGGCCRRGLGAGW